MAASPTERDHAGRSVADVAVRAVRTRPDRFVFIADGHPDAWIASDLIVDITD